MHVAYVIYVETVLQEVGTMAVETKDVPVRVRIRPGEFARQVDVSTQQVYRWIYAGKLKAALVGRVWLIPVSELTEFFEREAA